MDRRIFGLETEYGLTCTREGRRALGPDEVARHMFRSVVAWGRSSNVFLPNGSRLYLDVGNHPEYATAECDSLADLLAQDEAGTTLLNDLVDEARARLAELELTGTVYLFKNNLDSAGNSYGCHENYLVSRSSDLARLGELLVPFLVSRQIVCGAGRLMRVPDGAGERVEYHVSQRADVMWEGTSSATTRSRPMINTRDEPHADAERYRRLHIIVGDSNLAQSSTLLKVGATDLVLRMHEAGEPLPDLSLVNPAKAIRAVSRDPRGAVPVELTSGRALSATALQREFQERAAAFVDRTGAATAHDAPVLELWDRVLTAIESDRPQDVVRDVDWILKRHLLTRYADRHGLGLEHPRIAQLELAYHDVEPGRGLFALTQARGGATTHVSPADVQQARRHPPATTRAAMRGAFVAAAREHGRDYTVDWTHLRLNDGAGRTVLCKDPFAATDPRVDRLLNAVPQPVSDDPTPA
ncbi:proteasome accessory factor A [Kineosphaera limosa]|uniref:Pup--protein ligase n=1 Tax=Kineosphaera limosa NBRC 100340 TaxID=1184609 RepID=K6W5V1_9MICO|nr:Pup--protein ligase [Kineosphaera limosa]NYE03218.1 proteasome accessory factor A [Kineosphaera limosa]GAB94555.1 Pup--protein ligase [Kineosphaera limosa NBRC 100340]